MRRGTRWSGRAIGRKTLATTKILARARDEGRILVTLDKDFGELAVRHGKFHCGILRLVSMPAGRQASVCLQVLASHGPELASGAIITAEPGRLRIRLP